jgi:hypothetical protein
MKNVATVPLDQLNRIERRVKSLEDAIRTLIEKVQENKSQKDDTIFHQMVNSDAFQKEVEETIQLYREDPSQFSDPFETYKQRKSQS